MNRSGLKKLGRRKASSWGRPKGPYGQRMANKAIRKENTGIAKADALGYTKTTAGETKDETKD